MTLRMGIDIGTSGIRSAIIDPDGELISSARTDHVSQTDEHIDAEKWWIAVKNCIQNQGQELRKIGRDLTEITGIAVDGTSGSMVLTDENLNPVSPAFMYNSKGFLAEADQIHQYAPNSHITRGSNSALARAMRLNSLASKTPAHLLHQADFVTAKLIGIGGYSDDNNALKTGFDPDTREWPSWIGDVFPTKMLPNVVPVGQKLDFISLRIANELGFSSDVGIYAGTTDSIAAFLAAAPIEDNVAVTSLGSTLAIKAISARRIDAPSIGLYSHRIGDFWLAGGASNTGGAVLAHYFTGSELNSLSQKINPEHPTDLKYYPLLEPGERFPIDDPDLAPCLTPRPEKDEDFLQAMLESMADIEAKCYQSIVSHGGDFPSKIFTAGGGAKNSVWQEIRARKLGIMPQNAKYQEASIGAARIINNPALSHSGSIDRT